MKKIILLIIISIIILLGINIGYAYSCYNKNTIPKFSKQSISMDGGTIHVKGIGYKIYYYHKLCDEDYEPNLNLKAFKLFALIDNNIYEKTRLKNNRAMYIRTLAEYELYYNLIDLSDAKSIEYWNGIFNDALKEYNKKDKKLIKDSVIDFLSKNDIEYEKRIKIESALKEL